MAMVITERKRPMLEVTRKLYISLWAETNVMVVEETRDYEMKLIIIGNLL
ncbi:MAG: hypothetical protein PVH79_00585 [Candidatus Bathyarchaeota archaeon]|jgi:hypothetical protein